MIRECNDSLGTGYGMYLLSGSQTLTVTFLDGIELNLDPKAVFVRKGAKVTFTARSRGTIVGGPMWKFTKSDSLPDQTTQCGTNPCDVIAMNSGTLRATAWLYGRWRSDAAAIKIFSSFTLESDKTFIDRGDTVTFTPKFDGHPGGADHWQWRPDSTGSPDSVARCQDGASQCVRRMAGSGTMIAWSGTDSASAHITVRPVPCPLDNPVLNDLSIRRSFKDLIMRSGPTLPPGDPQKREHGGLIYRRSDGSYYFKEYASANATECSVAATAIAPKEDASDVLVGRVHAHPTESGHNPPLKVYGCPPSTDGKTFQQYPGDPNGLPVYRGQDIDWGGGSESDWKVVAADNTPDRIPPVNGYVINADGEVWTLPADLIYTPSSEHLNRKVNRIWGTDNPACTWQ